MKTQEARSGDPARLRRGSGDPAILRRSGDPWRCRKRDPAIRRSGDPAIRRSGDPAIRRSGDPAIRRSGDYTEGSPLSPCQARNRQAGRPAPGHGGNRRADPVQSGVRAAGRIRGAQHRPQPLHHRATAVQDAVHGHLLTCREALSTPPVSHRLLVDNRNADAAERASSPPASYRARYRALHAPVRAELPRRTSITCRLAGTAFAKLALKVLRALDQPFLDLQDEGWAEPTGNGPSPRTDACLYHLHGRNRCFA